MHPARKELRAETVHVPQRERPRAAPWVLRWARPMARATPEEIQLRTEGQVSALPAPEPRFGSELVVHPALARAKRQSPRAKRRMRLQTQGGQSSHTAGRPKAKREASLPNVAPKKMSAMRRI